MSKPEKAAAQSAEAKTTTESSLLDQIVEQGRFGKEQVARERGRDMVKEFVAQVLEGEMKLSRDADATINARIAQIDHLLSLQLNEILHHPAFQKLEASWRGIKYMMDQSETSSMLKIRVLNVSKKEPVKGFDVSERLGSTLGRAVLNASTNLDLIFKPSLAERSVSLNIPLQDITPEQLADARSKISKLGDTNTDFFTKVVAVKTLDLAEHGSVYPMEVQVFRFDADTALVCLPCEIFVELGLAIKQASPFKKTIVMSICNDRPSYVPTRKAFGEGSYEVTNSRVKPGSGEMLVDAAVGLLKKLKD